MNFGEACILIKRNCCEKYEHELSCQRECPCWTICDGLSVTLNSQADFEREIIKTAERLRKEGMRK